MEPENTAATGLLVSVSAVRLFVQIPAFREDRGLRWQREAATPL
jgi:hypothetical protein